MLSRSIFVTSILSLCLAGSAIVGCSASTAENDEEAIAESSDELSAAAKQLVGKYWGTTTAPRQFGKLTLNADGTYTARVDITDVAFCVVAPCHGPESGKWNAVKSGGKLRLRLRAQGSTSRWYDADKTGDLLKLTRNGATQILKGGGLDACVNDSDCSANQECAPKMCLMWCAVDDPLCCGTSTCVPKAPQPTCCDPTKKPTGGIEGYWCCGDGSWQGDIGNGDQQTSCGSHGGAGQVCGGGKSCGGFAGLPCGPNEQCVDDPTDSCDPNNGGADCSGICVSTTPPPPPPPPSCWGSWLDQFGNCRSPSDGVYPDSCCAGQTTPCGPSKCGVGETCCNSLSGICTKPNEVCAF